MNKHKTKFPKLAVQRALYLGLSSQLYFCWTIS